MTISIKVVAPTVYHYNSLQYFGLANIEDCGSYYVSSQTFKSIQEARAYLKTKAKEYYGKKSKWNNYLGVNHLEIEECTAYINVNNKRYWFD